MTTGNAYVLKAEPTDVFRIFVIRLPITLACADYPRHRVSAGQRARGASRQYPVDRTPIADLDARDAAPCAGDGLRGRAVYPTATFSVDGQIAPLVPDDPAAPRPRHLIP